MASNSHRGKVGQKKTKSKQNKSLTAVYPIYAQLDAGHYGMFKAIKRNNKQFHNMNTRTVRFCIKFTYDRTIKWRVVKQKVLPHVADAPTVRQPVKDRLIPPQVKESLGLGERIPTEGIRLTEPDDSSSAKSSAGLENQQPQLVKKLEIPVESVPTESSQTKGEPS